MLDTCHYCRTQYHPMPVWVLTKPIMGQKEKIRVCRSDECERQAEDDGYKYRKDLTPRR